jgi:15-cis-phytoene synthase
VSPARALALRPSPTQSPAPLDPQAAIALGQRQARAILAVGSKSFALAGLLLDESSRADAAVLYAWCRRADDRVDDAGLARSARATRELRRELDDLYGGRGGTPLELALTDVIERRHIPRAYFEALLDGFAMDAERWTYTTWADLDRYAYRVAGVVGLMMCHVLGVRDDRCLRAAAHLGMAMQLTNIARDVAEDWQRERQYLPSSLISPGELRAAMQAGHPADPSRQRIATAVAALLARADDFYRSGFAGLVDLGWRNALAIGAAGRIYRAIGHILAGRRYDALAGRAVVSLPRKLWATAAAALSLLRALPARFRDRKRPVRPPHTTLRFDHVVLR